MTHCLYFETSMKDFQLHDYFSYHWVAQNSLNLENMKCRGNSYSGYHLIPWPAFINERAIIKIKIKITREAYTFWLNCGHQEKVTQRQIKGVTGKSSIGFLKVAYDKFILGDLPLIPVILSNLSVKVNGQCSSPRFSASIPPHTRTKPTTTPSNQMGRN